MKPYFHLEDSVSLYHADAMQMLENLQEGSAKLIFADPPYFLSNDGITCKSGKMETVNKGAWDKASSLSDMHEFNLCWLNACREKLDENGTIFVSGTQHNIYSVGFALQSLGFKILNDIAWFKVNPPPNLSCRYFTHSTETIIWAKKSAKAKHTFNYELMKELGDPTPGKQMLSLWRITPPKQEEKIHGKHPTQKPLALLNRIILAASNPGDLVIDPFVGSGTTAVAALRNGRRFIGSDLEADYLEVAKRRVLDTSVSLKSSTGSSLK